MDVCVCVPTANSAMSEDLQQLRVHVTQAVHDALLQLCGGGNYSIEELAALTESSVSFPNKKANSNDLDGKPYDIEVKAALSFFHQCRKRKREDNDKGIIIISELGLERAIASPFELAVLIARALEESCRGVSHDVRAGASGIICMVTPARATALRELGRLPCPLCIKWCKGEKGLWWHQQQEHGAEFSVAKASAASERQVLAIVPFQPQQSIVSFTVPQILSPTPDQEDIYEWARIGDLKSLMQTLQTPRDVANSFDRKGASALHWAAGSGHLAIVQYLINDCGCDPNQGQRGKRSFSGRTALHWAARNGHLDVVRHLVQNCNVMIDASTADGTTAFCWACWQGHLKVMKFLHSHACNIHKKNAFGCNAVLWCAQGEGARLETLQWLKLIGCSMCLVNSNGHGALHKSAQRGRDDIVGWLVEELVDSIDFAWIGPDSDGYCPSDLAGVGGHVELARQLATVEIKLATRLIAKVDGGSRQLPEWLRTKINGSQQQCRDDLWEPWAGVRRLQTLQIAAAK